MAVAELNRILRVLVVDPMPDTGRNLRDLFTGQDEFRFQSARDIADAAGTLTAGAYDAAIVDAGVWADDRNGFARAVRDDHPDVAIILLTSGDNPREMLPSLKLGAHDFVCRAGLDRDQLAARILAAVEEARAVRRRDTMVRWLEREARIDHLTGLFNRRAFDEQLRDVCTAARIAEMPVALIVIDIEGTRVVNEAHGHEAGDSMIRRAASGIARTLRAADFAARIGGDDFAVIIENADLEIGRRIARRIAHEVERLNATEWDGEIPVTLTFGVVSGLGCDAGELVDAGDAQLASSQHIRPVVTELRWREESHGPSVA
ncbi:MAG: diguanylate cyclase [Dehalococcoidia bacterium]|nr:diguanylate cyclase [Dehalococcoidia bacterium]